MTNRPSQITLEDVHWRYEDQPQYALLNIDIEVSRGEVVGIIGSSGAGKTSLLLTLSGLIPANYQGDFSGGRHAEGEVGIVFQDPETQFVGQTVEEEIAFSLENQGLDDPVIERRISNVLQRVGLDDFSHRSLFELSGGEKQRVAIASVLAATPDIMLLDEPTSELDPIGSKEVFRLLQQLKKEGNIAIIISSHDTEELASLCDRMLLLSSGQKVYDLPTPHFFANVDELTNHGVYVPDFIQLHYWLQKEGMIEQTASVPLSVEEMIQLYEAYVHRAGVYI